MKDVKTVKTAFLEDNLSDILFAAEQMTPWLQQIGERMDKCMKSMKGNSVVKKEYGVDLADLQRAANSAKQVHVTLKNLEPLRIKRFPIDEPKRRTKIKGR